MTDEVAGGAEPEWLGAPEAARRLGVKPATLYAYVSRGQLRRRQEGRRSRYHADDIAELAVRGRRARPTRPSDIVLPTAITAITPCGPVYRGVPAVDLAGRSSYEEVAARLWEVDPTPNWHSDARITRAARTAERTAARMTTSPTAADGPSSATVEGSDDNRGPDPAAPLLAIIAAARSADAFRDDLRPVAVTATAQRLVAALVDPDDDGAPGTSPTVAARAAKRLAGTDDAAAISAIDAALVVLADHELAASTLAVRVAASARADLYAALLAGAGVLSGGRHGAASRPLEVALTRLAHGWAPEEALAAARTSGGGIAGFGHPLYPDGDPRATRLLEVADDVGLTAALEPLRVLIEVAQSRGFGPPTIDTALAGLTDAVNAPIGSGEFLFTIARISGWVAHALEQYGDPALLRPRAVYTGP